MVQAEIGTVKLFCVADLIIVADSLSLIAVEIGENDKVGKINLAIGIEIKSGISGPVSLYEQDEVGE